MKFAQQGVRQMASLPSAEDGHILKPGESFIRHDSPGTSNGTIVFIAEGTIGIVHKSDGDVSVSVISDDCKAARKAIAAFGTRDKKIYSQKDALDKAKAIIKPYKDVKLAETLVVSRERNMTRTEFRNAVEEFLKLKELHV